MKLKCGRPNRDGTKPRRKANISNHGPNMVVQSPREKSPLVICQKEWEDEYWYKNTRREGVVASSREKQKIKIVP